MRDFVHYHFNSQQFYSIDNMKNIKVKSIVIFFLNYKIKVIIKRPTIALTSLYKIEIEIETGKFVLFI